MNFFKKNKVSILVFIIGLSLGAFVMSLFIPEVIVPLKDGNLPIVTLNDFSITSNEYYEALKDTSDIDYLTQLIDEKLLDKMYETTVDMKKEVQQEMQETIKNFTEYYGYSESEFLNLNGFKTEEAFFNLMLLEHKRELFIYDYVKDHLKNEEINNYYIKTLVPDMEIKTISGDEEILDEILDKLKNKSYDEIIKEYKNKITYKDYSYVSFDDKNINEDIYAEVLLLEENSYTTSLISINGVYHIIFKGDVKEKDNIDEIRDRLKDKIATEKINNDTNNELYYEALINLRKENNITFNDTILEEEYNDYIKLYK